MGEFAGRRMDRARRRAQHREQVAEAEQQHDPTRRDKVYAGQVQRPVGPAADDQQREQNRQRRDDGERKAEMDRRQPSENRLVVTNVSALLLVLEIDLRA